MWTSDGKLYSLTPLVSVRIIAPLLNYIDLTHWLYKRAGRRFSVWKVTPTQKWIYFSLHKYYFSNQAVALEDKSQKSTQKSTQK